MVEYRGRSTWSLDGSDGVPTSITLRRPPRSPGNLIAPFAFDPVVQLMLWRGEAGAHWLTVEAIGIRGGFNWAIDLGNGTSQALADELAEIQAAGMKGVWKLGRWPRQLRFQFHGLPKRPGDPLKGSLLHVSVLPVLSVGFSVRPASFERLRQAFAEHPSN